jgi:hypothetical protein
MGQLRGELIACPAPDAVSPACAVQRAIGGLAKAVAHLKRREGDRSFVGQDRHGGIGCWIGCGASSPIPMAPSQRSQATLVDLNCCTCSAANHRALRDGAARSHS